MYNSHYLMHILLLIILLIYLLITLTSLLLWHLLKLWHYSTLCLDKLTSLSSPLNILLLGLSPKPTYLHSTLTMTIFNQLTHTLDDLLAEKHVYSHCSYKNLPFTLKWKQRQSKFLSRYNMTIAHKNHPLLSITKCNYFKNPNHLVFLSPLP